MHRVTLIALLLAAAASSSARAAAQTPLDASDFARTAERDLRRYAASGAAVAVVGREGPLLLAGYGRTAHEGGAAVTPDVPFGTVKLRDLFTALAAVRLDEAGRVDLGAPIGVYAGDLPPRIGAITLAQLLSHTGGLDDAPDERRRRRASTVWPGATDRALFTEPGAIHSFSRHGLPLARAILAVRSGRDEASLLERLVIGPAGMDRTTLDPARAEALGAVPGLVVSTTGTDPQVALGPTANPMPQLYTTARDLARLLELWLAGGGTALTGDVFDAVGMARAPLPGEPPDSVGLGAVRIGRPLGLREVSWADGGAGYGAVIRILPDAGVAVAVLANATGATLRATADTLLAAALSARGAATGPAPGTEPATLPGTTALAGTYANGDGIIVLEARGDGLYWVDGGLSLPVRRTAGRLEAVIGDGRVARSFGWTRDAAGRAYVIVDGKAYRRAGS